ncbi:LOW QUALITY PROTEIN: sacsin-like [Astatotilapia calliptera]|uniref:LOW QUALITY PROTEIN: sacsin-like n=1 Tax=Astatotilapia calliptera TaxID=8154 RepID=UPI000E417A48|nr:LOW QUALITY PROTEIN: sacsin-like [Astatotilapia calliptera]
MSLKAKKKARTSFGATAPPFIDYLKDILRRYPDGGQILKELIQNADDAGATEVVFIHDERSYGTESLWTEELGKYQGPALYAYNNATFTDEDWQGIQMAGRSVKRDDPNKVGRFGIGFNSVYHTTDVPSIFSSEHLGMMDPQEKIFGERNGGFWWSLDDVEDQEVLLNMHDQFQPFRDIVSLVCEHGWSKVVMEDQHFNGTIFRFPLRNEASEISDNLYDSDKVVELFDSFIADADLSLLFLKNVTSVSLLHISEDGAVNTRLEVKSSVPTDGVLEPEEESVIEGLTRFKVITVSSKDQKETKWLLTTCTMKEGVAEDLDLLTKKLSFLPQVDLAFPCGEKRDCSQSRLSCFLPLPNNESNKTGLPVYVNACFGLTDNRRHIKWQEEDQRHDEHALWNEMLMKKVFPQAYIKIIQDAIKLAQKSILPVSSVYNLWPDLTQIQHKEKWHALTLDVFHHLFRQNVAILSLAKDERQFISPSEAVFPCNGPTSTNILSAIKRALVSCGENLVTLPASVAKAINEAYPNPTTLKHVTPAFLRAILHRTSVDNITKDDKLSLLEYILGDEQYKELEGLHLLPLSDGSFRYFTYKEEDTALIDSHEFPRLLLPFCKHLFIPNDLTPACSAHLKKLARRNFFKIINVDASRVAEYTRRYLPPDCKQTGKNVVTWENGNIQHPPLDWFQEFWRFLNNHFDELSPFTDIPLIPVSPLSGSQTVSVAKLQQNTTLIFQKSKQLNLPDQITQLLNKVGGTVVRGNEWLKHVDLDSYVLCPSPRSVLKVLMNLDFQHLVTELKSASYTAREELKDYLSYLDSLSKKEKDFLLKLPLFQTMKGFSVAAQSKQAVLLISGLTVPTELPMPDSIIQCSTETDRRLLQLLKVHLLDTAEAASVLVDSIRKGTCSSDNTNKTMTWVLQHGKVLFSQNESLKCSCKDLSFIEVNGQLKKASDFFDPRIQTFKVIFESDFFPPPSYTHSLQMLESLTEIGLLNKEMDVSPEHLLHAATLTDKLCVNSQIEALRRGQVLLEMVESNDLLTKFSHKQLHCLKMLKWIPCEQPGSEKQFSDKSQKYCLFCPNEIRHSVYKDIVGHVMPLTGKLSDRVSNRLGLKDLPPPEKVTENLSVLKSKALEMVNPDTDVDFKRQLHSIYKHMQDNLFVFVTMMGNETCWLWAQNQFVAPQDLVLEYPNNLDLSSYIGKMPNEFLPYRTLFQRFGLRTVLSNEDILGILYSIQQTIEARQQSIASSSEVKVSTEILKWLWKEKKTVQDDIPVPVIAEGGKFTLKPRSTALFCDVSKNGLKELNCREEEIYVIHEEIPKAAAEWLEIRFLSTHILDPEEIGIEQCGQSEPITMRIKNILKEYDEDSDIFKELIQNAEDAGADVCKFLVDFRVHRDAPESLIDPDMALCQGPCLWAFNNEQFTAEDWKNIVRVGSASKENKVEKIGKFGLGFNTVYHVTDVPSILSGNTLLILDPNVTHLTKHIKHKSNPGIKLDLSQQRFFHCFPGQFGSYENIFDCNFTRKSPPEPYPGTLIKLPFRSEEEAVKSEISTNVYQKPNILDFQHLFSKNSQTHLLFLKNIITLSLQNIPHNGSTPPRENEMETIFSVSKTTVSAMEIPDDNSVSKQRHAEKSLMKLDGKCKELINCYKFSIVKISSQQSNENEIQLWLLYNCFGTDESFKMAIHKNKQASFSLPIGGIAVPLQNHPETGKFSTLQTDLVGQAFCFLPLPIHTGLPVNVNGTFAVTSNRKGLWETGVKNDWNKALLQDPVVTAYVTVLKALKKMSEDKQLVSYCYHTFWPEREKVTETFKPLVDALYSTIVDDSVGPELFSDGEQWFSMNNAIFLHESIENDEKIGDLAVQVCQKYAKGPNHVVPLPLWLRNTFKQAGLEKVLQNRTWNWEKFYREAVFSNLTTMDSKSRDTLVLHAIDLHIKEIDNLLLCYACIPTKGGQLQHVRKLVNPTGKVACLFEPKEGRLLDGSENDFRSPKRIQRLLELGMANDHLPLEDITEKAGTIDKTWSIDKKKAFVHLRCLFELMKNHIYDIESHHWKTLRTTAFLPAYSPGDAKMEGNISLKRPADVFSDKCSLLVNMTQPVLDHTNLNIHNTDPVLLILGVHSTPKPEMVLMQLHQTSKQAHSIDRSMLYKIASECYKFLDQWISHFGKVCIPHWASSFPFILIGDTFVNVDRVAENGQFEAKPYLHVLPAAFTSFRNLWTCIGVEKHFTKIQFLTVLQELKAQHVNKPLPKSDLSVVLTILNKGIFEAKLKITDDCLIPNEHGVLQPANELFYNDSPWMPLTSGVTLCHENIPRVMARHLGIKTTRHHTLENHIVDDMSPFAFDFEQQEQLTVRIKNIISAYPSKKDILKELIQNADDAEATEIHFIWDKRQHGKVKTFGKKWNNLQGPALCVFNNKVFSDADIKGIQQLGEGGKHSTPGKIGKYGVGFNSVYHLTDCPSILTGDEVLCISDPNQKYIENHSNNQRYGIGYKLADTFKEMYVDVYKSFLPDKFSLKEGTMFRLPLRMGTNANASKISQQGVTDRDMKELCSALSEDPEGLILFLKNICKIKVHEISEDSQELKTIFEVEKTLPQRSRDEKDAFVKHLQNALQSDKTVTPHKTFYETVISTSDKRQSKWIVAEQFGSFKYNFLLKISDKLPQASLAARVNTKGYLMDFKGEAFCSLPLPGKTGLPVHVNGNFEVDSARRSLWKEDGKSKKSNWNEILKQNVIAPLYADLLHYIRRMITVKKVSLAFIGSCFRTEYLCFWPTVSKDVCPDWHEMIHGVYRSLKEKGLDVIPVMKSSTQKIADKKIKEYSFDWCNVSETDSLEDPYLTNLTNYKLMAILEDLGMKLVPYSTNMQRIWKSFRSAGVEVKEVSPSSVQIFLRAKPLNDPTQTDKDLPLPISATLIKDETRCSELLSFCLKDFSSEKVTQDNSNLLDGLPLLLTRDKVLTVFNSQSPKWISRYANLFFGCEETFADYHTNIQHIRLLQTFNFVKTLTLPCAARALKPFVQHLLKNCYVDPLCGLHVPNETMLEWLKSLWMFITSEIKLPTSRVDEQSLTLSDVRKLFSDCYILPVVCPRLKNKHFLQTMKHMSSVVFASQKHKDISGILFKLGFMRFDHVFFSEMDRWIYSCLQDELLDVDDESSVLDQVYNINRSEFSHLSNDDMKEFQMFLQSGLSKSKVSQEYVRKLKSLPIFETTHGERVRIDGPKKVYVLNSVYSVKFPDLFNLPNTGSIFLKHNSENYTLSQTLNIQVLNDLEYFMKFILPVVHQLTESQILHSLKLLLSLDYSLKERKIIISSLKTVKLIRSSQGRLEPASYYFDERVELYKRMLPHEKFVPERFWTELCEGDDYTTEKAKELVRKLGMKHVVSADEIIHFAYQLESEAKVNRRLKDMKLKSSLLFREALNKACDPKDNKERLLESIADIKFIFPVMIRKELSNYHQPFAPEGTTVKIRGSLIEKNPEHQDLIWSSMPIIHLPVYTTQKLLQMMKNAGAHEEPPPNCVTSNIRNICQSPCETDQLIKTRAKVFRSSYAYLQAKRFEGNQLAGLPVVLVEKDTKLMRPDDVCLSLSYDRDFRPYLYKITPEDAMYAPFFQKIGVKNEATAEQYCNVLAAVYADSCDKQKLHSNQLRTVKRAVEQLFKLISAQGNETLLENVETLYLPAVDGKLYPSSTLCYNDTVFETKRLEEALENKFLLLEKLSECYLGNDKYKHHQLLQLLPQKFQPKMLSEFTEERVVESKMQRCELGTGCEFSGWFAKHLSSGAFKYGFICLIREQLQGKITQEDASNICQKIFGSIQIICCKTLKTTLWLNKQPLPKTDEENDVFVERGQQGCTFYLKHNDDMAVKVINEVIMTLTKEINALLGNRIASVHLPVLGQLLMCDDLQDVRKTLAKHQIRDSAETESSSFSPAAPGTEVPEEWHDCLDMNVLNNFEEGEYVGYSIDDKYIYAVIVEELPGHNGRYSWRYKIDIGEDEPTEVSCVDLFQFKREKKVKTERRKCIEPGPQKKTLKPEENTCMELEPLTGAVPHSSESSTNSLPASVEEAKREIDKCLAEIWRLPEEERHKAIKRLYLRWHPDKNPDCQSLANEAFKYLQNRIDELSKPKAAGSTFSSRNTNFRGFYQQWNQEARYHRNSRERFSRGYRGFHSYNFWTHNENVPRPDREEARRWCRQARCDLNAAHKDTGGGSTEWCLFKVHQAVEKSLIAACYKRNGQRPNSSSISATAAQVSRYSLQLRDLPEIVKNLQTLGVDPKRTQYPNCHPYPHIPNGRFRSENEMLALNKASELLNKIEAYVN